MGIFAIGRYLCLNLKFDPVIGGGGEERKKKKKEKKLKDEKNEKGERKKPAKIGSPVFVTPTKYVSF